MRPCPTDGADDVDLNPLIDVVTILMVFFIIGGRIATPTDGITVPPARTGAAIPATGGEVLTIDVRGDGRSYALVVGDHHYAGDALERQPLADLRGLLDAVWERAPRRGDGAPDVRLRVRADQATPYRQVQDVLAVAADAVDPLAGTPREAAPHPFTDLRFAVRGADGG